MRRLRFVWRDLGSEEGWLARGRFVGRCFEVCRVAHLVPMLISVESEGRADAAGLEWFSVVIASGVQ